MGKKSKNTRKSSGPPSTTTPNNAVPPPPSTTPADAATPYYPSDGPSQEELERFPTTNPSLQAKLDQLTQLALANDRAGFVEQFVPLDLSAADRAAYGHDLTTAPEADGQWTNLAAEIAALSAGQGVRRIEGDQQTRAVFFFEHPLLPGCDREVTFVCAPGSVEWRAEG